MALYSDTFANLTNWTEIGPGGRFSISSNQLLATANATPTRAAIVYNTQLASLAQYQKIQYVSSTGASIRSPKFLFRRTGTAGNIFYNVGTEVGSQGIWWGYSTDDSDLIPEGTIASNATGFSSVLAAGEWIGAEVTGTGANTIVRVWKWASDPGTRDNWGVASVQFTTDPGANAADTGLYVGVFTYIGTSGDTITLDTWAAGDLGDINPMGPFLPTAAQTIAEAPWDDANCTWVNPNNIFGAGEAEVTHASFDSPDQTYVLKAYGFDFSSILDGATINGLRVVIRARYAVAAVSLDLCQLLDISRAKVGTNKYATPQALTTSAADYTIGGPTDKWDNLLTAAWVKDPDFGVAIGAVAGGANSDVFIDSVTMTVWYTAAATYTKTVSLDSYLKKVFTKTPSIDGLLNKAGQTKTLSLDSLLNLIGGVPATDNFNRSDGPIGSSWTNTVNSLVISGNKVIANTVDVWNIAKHTAASFANDQYSQARYVLVNGSTDMVAVFVRIDTAGTDGYDFTFDSPDGKIKIRQFGALIVEKSMVLSNGDIMRLEAVGTSLKGYINGALELSTTDANLTSGSPGIGCYYYINASALDDWEGGSIPLRGEKIVSLDAILYAAETYYLTGSLDAVLNKTGLTRTALADALLAKLGLTAAAFLDAYLKKTFEKTPTIDAYLQLLGLKTPAIDAMLNKAGIEKTASLDSLLQKIGAERTASLDAILFAVVTYTISASLDGLLNKTGQTKETGADALLTKPAQEKTVGTDAYLQKEETRAASLDAYLLATILKTPALDAVLNKIGLARDSSLDALLNKVGLDETASLDAFLVSLAQETLGVDAYLTEPGIPRTLSLDGYLQKGQSVIGSLDAFILGTILKTVPMDAALQKLGLTGTSSVDALLEKLAMTKVAYLDAMLLGLATKTLGLDAILFAEGGTTIATSVDALLNKVGLTGSSALDSFLQKLSLTASASMDAFLYAAKTRVLGIDVLLRKEYSIGSSMDALVNRLNATQTTELEALLLRVGAIKSTLMDALLSTSSSGITSMDSYLTMQLLRIMSLDATLLKPDILRTASLDAILIGFGEMAQILSLDAWLQRTSQMTCSMDALLAWGPRLASARYTYDAVARQREYNAGKRKREYDATPRKREHDDQ